MFVVIFRATLREPDAEYSATAARLRTLALGELGCLEFHAVNEGPHEVALSYWPSLEHIRAWKAHPEHLRAQELGRARWYTSYSVQIAELGREYRFEAVKTEQNGVHDMKVIRRRPCARRSPRSVR